MQSWNCSVISGKLSPRQFEYHPTIPDIFLLGTLQGKVLVVDRRNRPCFRDYSKCFIDGNKKAEADPVLGLCWLRKSTGGFIVGTSKGVLRHVEADIPPKAIDKPVYSRINDVRFKRHAAATSTLDSNSISDVSMHPENVQSSLGSSVMAYAKFRELTSVHVNSTDDMMLTSGYQHSVKIYDVATGSTIRLMKDIHSDHINISRFSNLSPTIFATSSFDKTIKLWDSRVPRNLPIYVRESERGYVMLCFSHDDAHLLTSGVDNEVCQHTLVDGRLQSRLDIPRLGRSDNYTRAYYTSSGNFILSGSSEEQVVRLHCSSSGRLIHTAEMYPGRKHSSLFIQSLRGSPHHDYKFSVLVNYRDNAYPLEIVEIDMLRDIHGGDISKYCANPPSIDLANDLRTAAKLSDLADVKLTTQNSEALNCHSSILNMMMNNYHGPILSNMSDATGREQGSPKEGEAVQHMKEIDSSNVVHQKMTLLSRLPVEAASVLVDYLYTDKLKLPGETGIDALTYADYWVSAQSTSYEVDLEFDLESGGDDDDEMPIPGRQAEQTGESARTQSDDNSMTRIELSVPMAYHLLVGAKILGNERLEDLIAWRCKQSVNVQNVIEMAELAREYNLQNLLQFCIYYIRINWSVIRCLPENAMRLDNIRDMIKKKIGASDMEVSSPCKAADTLKKSEDMDEERVTVSVPPQPEAMVSESLADEEMITFDRLGSEDEDDMEFDDVDHLDNLENSENGEDNPDQHGPVFSWLPPSTGHSCNLIFGDRLIFLGGGNRHQFLSFRQSLLFDISERKWSKVDASGQLPPPLIYHTATTLSIPQLRVSNASGHSGQIEPLLGEDEEDSCQYVIVFGGGHHRLSSDKLFLLDTKTMAWNRPAVAGRLPMPRTGHTMAVVERSSSSVRTRTTSSSSQGRGSGFFPGFSIDMVLFGGCTANTRRCLNDVHVLRTEESEMSHFPNPQSGEELSFSWITPAVEGYPPESRLAHTATMVSFPELGDLNKMIVFGGLGHAFLGVFYNDLAVLSISHQPRRAFRWESSTVSGEPPEPRYGHSATLLPNRQIMIYGGTSPMQTCSDVYILSVEMDSTPLRQLILRWSKVDTTHGIEGSIDPGPRSRHTACLIPSGGVFLFGGVDVFQAPATAETGSEGASQRNETETKPVVHWFDTNDYRWNCMETKIVKCGNEPPVTVPPSRLHVDLGKALDAFIGSAANVPGARREGAKALPLSPLWCDITFEVDDDEDECNDNEVVSFKVADDAAADLRQLSSRKTSRVFGSRLLLAARSRHFKAMLLTSGMKEGREGVVKLPGTRKCVFLAMMHFIYTDTLFVEPEYLLELLAKAHEYGVWPLERLCEGTLIRMLDVDNVCGLLEFADIYNLSHLETVAMGFIFRNYEAVKSAIKTELSLTLRQRLKDFRDTQPHAYMIEQKKHRLAHKMLVPLTREDSRRPGS